MKDTAKRLQTEYQGANSEANTIGSCDNHGGAYVSIYADLIDEEESEGDTTLQEARRLYLLQGIVTVLFGIAALMWPLVALISLVVLFAAFALIVGISRIAMSFVTRNESGWWLVLVSGIASIFAGVLAYVWPGLTAQLLLYVIGAQVILFGFTALWQTAGNWSTAQDKWVTLLSGIAGILFGVLAFLWPGATALTLAWLIGIYAVIFGVSEIVSSLLIRQTAT